MFFQFSYPGAPAIFYGDEVGLTGGDDPYNRGTYPWADLGGQPDMALHDYVTALAKMRREHPVLSHGSLEAPLLPRRARGGAAAPRRRRVGDHRGEQCREATTVRVQLPAGAPASSAMRSAMRASPTGRRQPRVRGAGYVGCRAGVRRPGRAALGGRATLTRLRPEPDRRRAAHRRRRGART
jgi:hypothetical protein